MIITKHSRPLEFSNGRTVIDPEDKGFEMNDRIVVTVQENGMGCSPWEKCI